MATPADANACIERGEDDVMRDDDGSLDDHAQSETPLSPTWRVDPLTPSEANKVMLIIEACNAKDREQLVALSGTEGGFIEDEMRRRAWPLLLGSASYTGEAADWHSLPAHRDEGQVKLDVHRAFVYYPQGESEKRLDGRKEELGGLIVSTLRRHPVLCYFQGYHDIAQVLLLVLGAKHAAPALARLSLLRIRDFMLPTLTATKWHLELLPAILYAADPQLCSHLSALQPYFALAATLTLFAHDIEDYGGIARLFDFILAREAVVSVYMFAVIVMTRKEELLEFGQDEPEMLYAILSKLPKTLNLDSLITQTISLYAQCPPETLPWQSWRKVSSASVLKTTTNTTELQRQTLQDGERWLQKQALEIERAETRAKVIKRARLFVRTHRRYGAISLAILIAAISLWLGRGRSMVSAGGLWAYMGATRQRLHESFGQLLAVAGKYI